MYMVCSTAVSEFQREENHDGGTSRESVMRDGGRKGARGSCGDDVDVGLGGVGCQGGDKKRCTCDEELAQKRQHWPESSI